MLTRILTLSLAFAFTSISLLASPCIADDSASRITHGIVCQTSHNGVFHYPTLFTYGEDGWNYMTLEDGSIWRLRTSDVYKYNVFNRWAQNHPIVIAANNGWFPLQKYRLINQATDETIYADLYAVPGYYGIVVATAHTRRVISINYPSYQLVLDDGSLWNISNGYTLQSWSIGDVVVIGINDSIARLDANILINYRTCSYVNGQTITWTN